MSDWIFCNKCTAGFNTTITFFLTECKHIFCHRCIEGIKSTRTCRICHKTTKVIELNANLEPSIACYFRPFEEIHKKTLEVYEFQLKQRNLFTQKILNKYAYAKKECIKVIEINKKLVNENKMLRSVLQNASQNSKFFTSTPIVSGNITNDIRSDMSSTLQSRFSVNVPGAGGAYPGSAHKMMPPQHTFTPSQMASPMQMVPNRFRPNNRLESVHRPQGGIQFSLDELRRSRQSK